MPKTVMQEYPGQSERLWPDETSGPWTITLTWEERADVIACTGLALRLRSGEQDASVTAALVRSLPVGKLISEAKDLRFGQAGGHLVEAIDRGDAEAFLTDPGFEDLAGPDFIAGLRNASAVWAQAKRGRPFEHDLSHYARVALIYSKAAKAGRPPRQAVAEELHTSESNASRWIRQARDFKLLPSTQRGKAKGQPTPLPGEDTK
jgi:hypothetical protein